MSASKTETAVQPTRWVAAWSLALVVDERGVTHHVYQDRPLPAGVDAAEIERLVAIGAVRQA